MDIYYRNDEILSIDGYEVYFTRYADSIIKDHFLEAIEDLKVVLTDFWIKESQIIAPGGGLSSITQSLRNKLYEKAWMKVKIESEHKSNGRLTTSESHEIDHYKTFASGNIGLEIEWNNKDPFFDRDLENFRKLHHHSEIAFGAIITRGISLKEELYFSYVRFLSKLEPFNADEIFNRLTLSAADKVDIKQLLENPKEDAIKKIATKLFFSKYGTSTTHMEKLHLRLERGVGNPCPLVLIGIGKERVILDQ